MKSVIMTIVALATISASAATYVTVQDCTGGESGQECRTVTYKVRNGKMVKPAQHPQGASSEGEVQYPSKTGIPAWLKALNDAFPGGGSNFPGDEAP